MDERGGERGACLATARECCGGNVQIASRLILVDDRFEPVSQAFFLQIERQGRMPVAAWLRSAAEIEMVKIPLQLGGRNEAEAGLSLVAIPGAEAWHFMNLIAAVSVCTASADLALLLSPSTTPDEKAVPAQK